MRKLVLFMHVSLDGYTSNKKGDLSWVKVDNELFDYAAKRTDEADTALYGRVTYDLMQSYWPTAADKPNASKHDIDHSKWYKNVQKIVVSKSLQGSKLSNATIIGNDLIKEVEELKNTDGKEIIIFGSPGTGQALTQLGLIDEYWLFVNPIILGSGIPLFKKMDSHINLELIHTHTLSSGVICLNYRKVNQKN